MMVVGCFFFAHCIFLGLRRSVCRYQALAPSAAPVVREAWVCDAWMGQEPSTALHLSQTDHRDLFMSTLQRKMVGDVDG